MTHPFKLAILTILGFLTLLNSGCHSFMNKIPEPSADSSTSATLDSFATLDSQIFSPKCVACHSAANPKGNVDMSSYAGILHGQGVVVPGHAESSLMYSEVASHGMPEGGPALSDREVTAIAEWINAGATDGNFASSNPQPQPTPIATPAPAPAPNPVPIATPVPSQYSAIQTLLFDKSCVRCHSNTKTSGNVNLANYQKLMGNARPKVIVAGDAFKSLVYTEIEKGSMPPSGARIDPQLMTLLKDWINAGAKN
ncbi:MAG: hypothetical protein H7326_11010 [Bdellovibrionaceae bacterium]|nr:hypothetical protein [Pseudobdellovibrionaceae bacterium]